MTTAVDREPPGPRSRRDLADFARGGVVSLASSIVAAASGLLLTIVVARTLGAAEAGVFFVVVALFTIASEVIELGADTGLVREAARLRALDRVGDLRKIMVAAHVPVLLAGIGCAIAAYFAAPWIAETFADPAHRDTAETLVRIAAPFLALSALCRVSLGGTRGLGSVAAFSLINNVVLPGSRPLLVGVVFAVGWGAVGVMVAWSIPIAVAFVAAGVVLWRMLRRVERAQGEEDPAPEAQGPSAVRQFWAFSGPRGMAAAVEMALMWANVPIVAALVSSEDAGIYATASRFISTGTLVLAATRIALAPQVAAMLTRGEHRRAEELNSVATRWVVLASWPIYLVLACFGPFVLGMFGEDFTGGAAAMAILAISMLIVLAAGNVQTVLLMGGKSSWSLVNKVVALLVNLALTFVLVPPYGIVGAAIAWVVAILIDTLATAVQVRWLLGLRLDIRGLVVTGALAIAWFGVLGVGMRLLFGAAGWVFVSYLVIALGGYGAMLWRLRHTLQMDVFVSAVKNRGRNAPENEKETA